MDYSGKLKLAKQFGEDSGNHEACENKYQCPFTGLEMNEAIKEANYAYNKNEVPVGGILVDIKTNEIIYRTYNKVNKENSI